MRDREQKLSLPDGVVLLAKRDAFNPFQSPSAWPVNAEYVRPSETESRQQGDTVCAEEWAVDSTHTWR